MLSIDESSRWSISYVLVAQRVMCIKTAVMDLLQLSPKFHPFDLIERDLVRTPVIELGSSVLG
jgi:hypothetical protein